MARFRARRAASRAFPGAALGKTKMLLMISQSFFNGFSRFWCLNYSTLYAEHDGTKIFGVFDPLRGQNWLVLGRALNKEAA